MAGAVLGQKDADRIHRTGTGKGFRACEAAATAVKGRPAEPGRCCASIVPLGDGSADLAVKVERGRRFRIDRAELSGELGLPAAELGRALQASRPRVRIPFLWTDRPADSEEAIEADVIRLRALYASREYFDAQVAVARIPVGQGRVALRYRVEAGRLYPIGEIRAGETVLAGGRHWARRLCGCLFDLRRAAGRGPGAAWSSASASMRRKARAGSRWRRNIATGPPYILGRIEFQGHHSYSGSTLRRVMTLAEGDPLDWNRLYQSLRCINELQLFQPIAEGNIHITQDPARGVANLTVALEERRRALWPISGPVGPASLGGPLTASVAARLQKFGQGVLEASTYYAAFGFAGFGRLARLLPLVPNGARWSASLSRPYLPGQEWLSGFSVSPQWGWKAALASYGLAQAGRRTRAWLAGGWPQEPVVAPVAFGRAPVLLCEAPTPGLRWLRAAAGLAVDWLLAGF